MIKSETVFPDFSLDGNSLNWNYVTVFNQFRSLFFNSVDRFLSHFIMGELSKLKQPHFHSSGSESLPFSNDLGSNASLLEMIRLTIELDPEMKELLKKHIDSEALHRAEMRKTELEGKLAHEALVERNKVELRKIELENNHEKEKWLKDERKTQLNISIGLIVIGFLLCLTVFYLAFLVSEEYPESAAWILFSGITGVSAFLFGGYSLVKRAINKTMENFPIPSNSE